MRIMNIITRSDTIGGAQIHVRDLALGLLDRGHEVLVAAGGQGPFVDELASRGVPFRVLNNLIRPLNPARDMQGFFELKRAIDEYEPDLVATHSSKAGFLGRLAARSLGVPVVFTAHGWAFTEGIPRGKKAVYRLAERLVSPFSNRIIAVSDYDRQIAIRSGVVRPHQIVTIHNGVPDVSNAHKADVTKEPPTIAMVARMDTQKDHETLLLALAGLKHKEWVLHLIGDGPLHKIHEKQADELGLTNKVVFWGSRQDIPELLAATQLFVLSSRWEGFPLTILEAMRAGLPVIASDVGGVREAIQDGITGFLVPPQDVSALREKLEVLLDSSSLRKELGDAGRERYVQLFTVEKMIESTLDLYNLVLDSY